MTRETPTETETDSDTDGDTDTDTDTAGSPVTRRQALAVLLGGGVGAAAARGVAQATSAASGGLGESGNALEAAFVAQLQGPILDQGTPITQLVNIRVEETGTTVNADPGTLIVRYQP